MSMIFCWRDSLGHLKKKCTYAHMYMSLFFLKVLKEYSQFCSRICRDVQKTRFEDFAFFSDFKISND